MTVGTRKKAAQERDTIAPAAAAAAAAAAACVEEAVLLRLLHQHQLGMHRGLRRPQRLDLLICLEWK